MTIFLADTLETIGKLSKANERNDAKHRPVLKETFVKQKDLSLPIHLANMKQWDDDDYQCYKFSDKLKGKKWNKYTMDALNKAVRDDFMKTLSFSGTRGEKN
jgi:hypothetical protein